MNAILDADELALRRRGFVPTEEHWSGMEASVVALDGGLVAKIWRDREMKDVERLQGFYADVLQARLPFSSPEIVDVFKGHSTISVEKRLHGHSMREQLDGQRISVENAMGATLDVLEATAGATRPAHPTLLPVFGMLPDDGESGSEFYVRVARERLESSLEVLEAAVPDVQAIMEALESSEAKSSPTGPDVLVHGDLCPENVLLDDSGAVAAVVDWGFLSGYGHRALDTAIASAIFDMYSEEARVIERQFISGVEERFGVSTHALLRDRALYAITTATAYSTAGEDGHFAWCAEILLRSDVRNAVFTH